VRQEGWRLFVKRAFDRTVGAVALVAASPIIGTTALAVRLSMGSPVLFRQQRGGFRGKTFDILKFRTMRDDTDETGRPLPDAERLTAVGRFLRSTSLDELPQLVNVLRGEVSLVGPRPFVARYLPRYTAEQARRHDVLPGITGWAQVNGRNALSWEDKFRLDVWYVDHWSLVLDLRILLMTVGSVLRGTGVSSATHATMEEFRGTAERTHWN
jgi:lipopolysaccharide/colanic/teichoic acid biosynthesis glycosyltransferase